MIQTSWMERLRTGETNWLQLGANAALLTAWLALYRPIFRYLSLVATREDFRTNQLVLLGILALVALEVRRGGLRLRLDAAPQLRSPPLFLALGGSLGFLLAERFLAVNTLSAALFGLATYGLLGLWVQPARWRQGLPVALLLIGVLPIGDHLQTFVGYPMRVATARIVRDGLAAAGVHSVGVDTILVFENGISQIDVPCSGVKSLWTGMLFLLAATWVQRKPLNWRWLLVAALFVGLLFVANLARVAVLVSVGEVAGWRLVAQMLHVPLGVLGFVAACAVAVFLLNRVVGEAHRGDAEGAECQKIGRIHHRDTEGAEGRWIGGSEGRKIGSIHHRDTEGAEGQGIGGSEGLEAGAQTPGLPFPISDLVSIQIASSVTQAEILPSLALLSPKMRSVNALNPLRSLRPPRLRGASSASPNWLAPALMVAIGLMAVVYTPRPQSSASALLPAWSFPTALAMEPSPLTDREVEWLARDGVEQAERWRFHWQGLSGSMIFVTSTTWRAHHRPERCFEVYGLSLDGSRTHLVDPGFPLRFVSLGDGKSGVLSASYWFQSAQRVTDDYGTRIWSDLSPQRERWVLVSILFDGVVDPSRHDVASLYQALRASVARGLAGVP